MASRQPYFGRELFHFLRQLRRNNNRAWFGANRDRYERCVRVPCITFVMDVGTRLAGITPYIVADPRPLGGSLFRIYRDLRFSPDKRPYKTHVGVRFFLSGAASPTDSPVFYLHLEPSKCFVAAGFWHPTPFIISKVRQAMVQRPVEWKKAIDGIELKGRSLGGVPRGYSPSHPYLSDLKRTDFVTSVNMAEDEVCLPLFVEAFVGKCLSFSNFLRFLALAVGLKV